MLWQEIRSQYPNTWILVEALKAHSENDKRIIEQLSVIDLFPDAVAAMDSYSKLNCESPQREYYVLHTHREEIEITERRWLGIRGV